MVNIVFSRKVKTHLLNVFAKLKLFEVYEKKTKTNFLNFKKQTQTMFSNLLNVVCDK